MSEGLAELLNEFQDRGELLRVPAEVQPDLEIAEITDRICQSMAPSPALLFERVAGSALPVVTNLLGSEWRVCRSLGIGTLDEGILRLRSLSEPGRSESWLDKLRQVAQGSISRQLEPQTVRHAPCQQVVRLGRDISLSDLPFIRSWPRERFRSWTHSHLHLRKPDSPTSVSGRTEVFARDDHTLLIPVYECDHFYPVWHNSRLAGQRVEVAITLGGHPSSFLTHAALLPPGWNPQLAAGLWRGSPLEQVKCRTIELEVPAQAELVLEGYVDPQEEPEPLGPRAGPAGCYRTRGVGLVMHLTAVTQRANPAAPICIFSRFSHEEYWINQTVIRLGLPLIQKLLPEVCDWSAPRSGSRQNTVFVAIRKSRPRHARQVLSALWGLAPNLLTRLVVIVDAGVNVHDPDAVWRAVAIHCRPGRDTTTHHGPADDPDPGTTQSESPTALGLDATCKWPGEDVAGGGPEDVAMSLDIQELVTSRWQDYGFPSGSRTAW
jgi:4-hydroxy-3-polyprenylbenzoate decarboxylase